MKKARLGMDPFKTSEGVDALIKDTREVKSKSSGLSKQSNPRAPAGKGSGSKAGLPPGWTRATFIVREDLLEKVKNLAYWDRKEIKEVVTQALERYLKGKTTKPIER